MLVPKEPEVLFQHAIAAFLYQLPIKFYKVLKSFEIFHLKKFFFIKIILDILN